MESLSPAALERIHKTCLDVERKVQMLPQIVKKTCFDNITLNLNTHYIVSDVWSGAVLL